MSRTSGERGFRGLNAKTSQQKRRDEALQRQQAARRNLTDHARKLASLTAESPVPVTPEADQGLTDVSITADNVSQAAGPSSSLNLRQYYAQQLMQPEWLTDVPDDLAQNWFVMARPEGQRCLVIASHQLTISRQRNGSILHRFPSCLPNGSRSSISGSGEDGCILDCIFHEADGSYYIMDMMCWKGYALYDCSAEFRLFWVQTKLAECMMEVSPDQHRYPFVPMTAHTCTQGGLQQAYAGSVPFQRDGLYFLHKEGYYSLDTSPLALLWKDDVCSQYFIDTDAQGVITQQQSITLQYQMDQTVATADKPPVVLGRMPSSFVHVVGTTLRPGKLLKFDIGEKGIELQNGQPVGADLKYTGLANQRRGRADTCSKVLFQYLARTAPLTLQQLIPPANRSQDDPMA